MALLCCPIVTLVTRIFQTFVNVFFMPSKIALFYCIIIAVFTIILKTYMVTSGLTIQSPITFIFNHTFYTERTVLFKWNFEIISNEMIMNSDQKYGKRFVGAVVFYRLVVVKPHFSDKFFVLHQELSSCRYKPTVVYSLGFFIRGSHRVMLCASLAYATGRQVVRS